jgi:predicted nucleotidyltransferase
MGQLAKHFAQNLVRILIDSLMSFEAVFGSILSPKSKPKSDQTSDHNLDYILVGPPPGSNRSKTSDLELMVRFRSRFDPDVGLYIYIHMCVHTYLYTYIHVYTVVCQLNDANSTARRKGAVTATAKKGAATAALVIESSLMIGVLG